MSLEKYRHDAHRWLAQAEADLRAAQSSTQAGSHEWACFQAQQAGEKTLKAFWLYHGVDPWGHSLLRLVEDFPHLDRRDSILRPLVEKARCLDKLYIPTRYPNGLPDLAPFQVYAEEDAQQGIRAALGILHAIRPLLAPVPSSNNPAIRSS
ncbi:MAG: HEPN domain-containing protein [Thermodesulfobacteriota bacterium]